MGTTFLRPQERGEPSLQILLYSGMCTMTSELLAMHGSQPPALLPWGAAN
jgi:hypothetical protein